LTPPSSFAITKVDAFVAHFHSNLLEATPELLSLTPVVFTYLKEVRRLNFDEHIKFYLRTRVDQIPDKRSKWPQSFPKLFST
jgi:hypothetical protein